MYTRAMKLLVLSSCLVLLATTLASAIPKPGDDENAAGDKKRVHEKILSDSKHFDEDEDHNPDYDHEAFLGRDEAHTFDDLSPEESKKRLAIIYKKIDSDKDGKVTEEELKQWIKYVQNRYVMEDTERQWKEHDEDEKGQITWETYKKRTYGFYSESENQEEEDAFQYKEMISRDERRWKAADQNGDGTLSKEEFANFLHPEEAEHMRGIVVDETIEDIDKDGDKLISLEEYIADMWPNHNREEEPDWVKAERESFHSFRDRDGDGKMDRSEVEEWIMPPDYDHSHAEARHLVFESDSDKDGSLTEEEVLNKYDLFVGSQATDFGEALTRHDEF